VGFFILPRQGGENFYFDKAKKSVKICRDKDFFLRN